MRTTLARQLRRRESGYLTEHVLMSSVNMPDRASEIAEVIRTWRAFHPRKHKQKPAKEHRRSRNRRGK